MKPREKLLSNPNLIYRIKFGNIEIQLPELPPVDMRKGFDGLAALVKQARFNGFSGHLYTDPGFELRWLKRNFRL